MVTAICCIKPEFRVNSDVYYAYGMNIFEELYQTFFSLFKEITFWFDEFSLAPRKRPEIRFIYESMQIRLTNTEFLFLIRSSNRKLTIETQVVSIFFSFF